MVLLPTEWSFKMKAIHLKYSFSIPEVDEGIADELGDEGF